MRKLPESYFKIITWKLEITSNKNSYIHTSETGYAKQARGTGVDPQQIKVVQLQAFKNGNYWDLSNKDGKFWKMLGNLKENYNFDFDIQINPVSVNTVNSYTDDQQMKNLLDQADMLIIGFTDGYDNISNAHKQVDAIVDFIKSGKSVLFSHDTTSYINYDQDKMYAYIADKKYDGMNLLLSGRKTGTLNNGDLNLIKSFDRLLEWTDTELPQMIKLKQVQEFKRYQGY